jgi:hypothetical protein
VQILARRIRYALFLHARHYAMHRKDSPRFISKGMHLTLRIGKESAGKLTNLTEIVTGLEGNEREPQPPKKDKAAVMRGSDPRRLTIFK